MPYAPRTKSVTPPEDKLFLSSTEVGRLLNLSPISVCHKIKSGELKASFIGRGWLVRRADLDRYVESKMQSRVKSRPKDRQPPRFSGNRASGDVLASTARAGRCQLLA